MTQNDRQQSNQAGKPERLRRPVPERKKPKRDVLGALGQSDPLLNDTMRDDFSFESWHPLGPGFNDAQNPVPSGGQSAAESNNFIQEGVQAASDLVNAHIRQGEQAAKSLNGGASEKPLSQPDLPSLLTGVVRAYSDAAAVWVEIVGSLAQNLEGSKTTTPHQGRATVVSTNLGLSIKCESSVEAGLDMFREAAGIIAQPLVSAANDTQTMITGVRYEAGEAGSAGRICVEVAKGQAPGTYHGLLLSEPDRMLAGVLTLRIPDDNPDSVPL